MKNSEKLTIKNKFLEIKITKIGAEICSITDSEGQEYIWQADPNVWGSHAPVLFPIIGALKNESFYYKGNQYNVPKHGFIRYNKQLSITDHKEGDITFQYKFNEETLKDYPFKFEFNITFSVEGKTLKVLHRVKNHGKDKMLFSLGGHPAFKCPLKKDEKYSDYELQFEKEETSNRYLINNEGLQNGKTAPFFKNTSIIPLNHDLFKNDALIFKDLKSKKISLGHLKKGKVLTVSYNDFEYIGIWAKTNGDFVCIEPWLGITDNENTNGDFENKEGIITLSGNQTFTAQFSIEIL